MTPKEQELADLVELELAGTLRLLLRDVERDVLLARARGEAYNSIRRRWTAWSESGLSGRCSDARRKIEMFRAARAAPSFYALKIRDAFWLTEGQYGALAQGGIKTVQDLFSMTWEDLETLHRFGAKGRRDLHNQLRAYGKVLASAGPKRR